MTDCVPIKALLEPESALRALIDVVPDSLFLMTPDGVMVVANETLARTFGKTVPQLIGASTYDLAPGEVACRRRGYVEQVMRTGEPLVVEEERLERFIESRIYPIKDDNGVITHLAVYGRDITNRKKTELALQKSEELISLFMRHSPIYAFIKEVTPTVSRVIYASDNYTDMIGISGESMRGMTMHELFPAEFADKITADDWSVVAGGKILQLEEQFKDRQYTSIKFPIVQGNRTLLAGYTIDITEHKQAKLQVEESRQQLRDLMAKIYHVREEEQTRIARDVHDVLGQQITSLKFDLNWCQRRLQKISEPEVRKELEEKLQLAADTVVTMMQTVRTISRGLRPSMLDDLGLEEAIQAESQSFEERTGITCRVKAPQKSLSLTADQTNGVFRIFQEILTNVARHAKASQVEIEFGRRADQIILKVSDNGCGIRKEKLADRKSLGLLGMHERAMLLQGQLEIQSGKQGGTVVRLTLPGRATRKRKASTSKT